MTNEKFEAFSKISNLLFVPTQPNIDQVFSSLVFLIFLESLWSNCKLQCPHLQLTLKSRFFVKFPTGQGEGENFVWLSLSPSINSLAQQCNFFQINCSANRTRKLISRFAFVVTCRFDGESLNGNFRSEGWWGNDVDGGMKGLNEFLTLEIEILDDADPCFTLSENYPIPHTQEFDFTFWNRRIGEDFFQRDAEENCLANKNWKKGKL